VIFLCSKKETEWERRRGQFRFYLSLRYSFLVLLAEEEEDAEAELFSSQIRDASGEASNAHLGLLRAMG
jgi:hypothetical protein